MLLIQWELEKKNSIGIWNDILKNLKMLEVIFKLFELFQNGLIVVWKTIWHRRKYEWISFFFNWVFGELKKDSFEIDTAKK